MRAMILAAGLGTRLMPLTADKPKALVEVGGNPLLQICISKLVNYGFKDIVVNVHHFADQIINFIEKLDVKVRIEISDETNRLLDTGGALVHARRFLDFGEPFLVHNVDILSDIDLYSLYQTHLNSSALATLAVSKRDSSRVFLFDNQMSLCGWRNMVTGKAIITKPSQALTAYAFSGIHVISPQIFSYLPQQGEFPIVDAYLKLSKDFLIQGVDLSHSQVIDVGKPESLELASNFISHQQV